MFKDNKIILFFIILVMIIIIGIIFILFLIKSNNQSGKEELSNLEGTFVEKKEDIYLVNDSSLYFSIKDNIMQKFLRYIENKDSKIVYDMLSKEYIDKESITIDNVLNKFPNYSIPVFSAKHMYMKEGDICDTIFINATIKNNQVNGTNTNTTIKEEYYKVLIDRNNFTYAIEPIEYKEYSDALNGKEVLEKNIILNKHNNFSYKQMTEENIAISYFNNYLDIIKYDTKRAYELLDEVYIKEKYKTYDQFENYIKDAYKQEIYYKEYQKQYNNDGTEQYKYLDNFNRVYIFKEIATMEYKVQLDDYTLENSSFNTKYDSSNDIDKAILNADKFIQMINIKDYTSAYSVLDEGFKTNYFKTQQDFENYIKNKMYEYNEIKYNSYTNKIVDIYSFKTILTDLTKNTSEEKEFNIIVKLLEDRKFIISFEV